MTKTATCRSKTYDEGLPWRCDRAHKHPGRHQVHAPRSSRVLKSWPRKGIKRRQDGPDPGAGDRD
ncbi:hypothetical protein ACQP2U_43690 (plasmid) [Nocardia sp. CA-084685]|uniref:hypothetical protein n=1 Tax=Nocardia sp. CA-084685 TaxID=3239970 RepID=UPI003D95BBB0